MLERSPLIPSKSNRKTPRPCDFALYCERNLIERFFNKLKPTTMLKLFAHVRLGPDVQIVWPGTPGKSTALFAGVRDGLFFE